MARFSWASCRAAMSKRCRAACCASNSAPPPAKRRAASAMRIIGGRHRGRAIAAPGGSAVRPTSDRAREALFDILAHGRFGDRPVYEEARVLDAFAGTGAFGLEEIGRAHV